MPERLSPAPHCAGPAALSAIPLPADQAGGRVLVLLDMLWLGHDATPASRRPPRGSGAAAPSRELFACRHFGYRLGAGVTPLLVALFFEDLER